MARNEYDLIVLGGGTSGENVADYAVQGGMTSLLVESELVGGECSYWACMPSKTLLRSAQALRAALHVDGAAQAITGTIDVEKVLARRDSFTHQWSDASQVKWAEGAGIAVVRGMGRIVAPKQVAVTATDGKVTTYTARHAVAVATGSRPLIPPIPGLADATPWTSREATSAKNIPTRFAIIGGGVVAAEMATAYVGLGSIVTLISRGGLLAGMEPFAGEMVHDWMVEQGITVLLNTETTEVQRRDGEVSITTSRGETIVADEVLIATGRVPATSDIGLENIGLIPGDWLITDDTLRVDGYDWLYAVGDVNHRALLTHQGKYQARAAGSVIAARALGEPVFDEPWGDHVATADHRVVPQVTFTEPEVASVGLTAEAAANGGYDTSVIDYEIGYLAGSSVREDDYKGTARMVIDEKRQRILGVTFVGPDVSEPIQTATLAIAADIPIDRLWHMVPAYPTVNEIWLRLLETYGRPAKHRDNGAREDSLRVEAVA